MSVRVLLDTTFARRAPYSGTAVYLDRLARGLSQLGGVDVVEACNRRRRPGGGGAVASVGNAVNDEWWTEVELPRRARACRADVIHHPLPARSRLTRIPQVVTVHDLAFERFPEGFDRWFRAYARRAYPAAARSAAAVICVSETTASEVRADWDVAPQRIVVAPHGPGQDLPAAERTPPEHFLYVGDDEPRKNLPALLEGYGRYRAVDADPVGLVLAGSARASGRGVRCEPSLGPKRLAQLYAGAVALVHPALHEGFGMTALEAMALGTPVIAAKVPAVREVCGDAARYVDPHDPRSIATAMVELAGSQQARDELASRGRRRASHFSWDISARRHRDAYSLATSR